MHSFVSCLLVCEVQIPHPNMWEVQVVLRSLTGKALRECTKSGISIPRSRGSLMLDGPTHIMPSSQGLMLSRDLCDIVLYAVFVRLLDKRDVQVVSRSLTSKALRRAIPRPPPNALVASCLLCLLLKHTFLCAKYGP